MILFASVRACATIPPSPSVVDCFISFDRIPGAGDIGDTFRALGSLAKTKRRPGCSG